MNTKLFKARRRQSGVTTLTITMLLLAVLTVAALFAASFGVFEQRTAASEYRHKLAFQAAEAGLNQAAEYIKSNAGKITSDEPAENGWFAAGSVRWQRCAEAKPASMKIDPCLAEPDGVRAAGGHLEYDAIYFPETKGPGKCPLQTVSSGPDARWSQIKEGYVKLILTAMESVYIQTPYFIPHDSISHALRIAAHSGVDVRIMVPDKPDHPFVYWSTLSFIGDLLDSGVKAYTYDNGFIHAKTNVVDGIAASVGSANFDIRSFRLNFEANAFFYDLEYGGQMKKAFLDDLLKCTEITLEMYKNRSRWIKAKEWVSRLFSPLG